MSDTLSAIGALLVQQQWEVSEQSVRLADAHAQHARLSRSRADLQIQLERIQAEIARNGGGGARFDPGVRDWLFGQHLLATNTLGRLEVEVASAEGSVTAAAAELGRRRVREQHLAEALRKEQLQVALSIEAREMQLATDMHGQRALSSRRNPQ